MQTQTVAQKDRQIDCTHSHIDRCTYRHIHRSHWQTDAVKWDLWTIKTCRGRCGQWDLSCRMVELEIKQQAHLSWELDRKLCSSSGCCSSTSQSGTGSDTRGSLALRPHWCREETGGCSRTPVAAHRPGLAPRYTCRHGEIRPERLLPGTCGRDGYVVEWHYNNTRRVHGFGTPEVVEVMWEINSHVSIETRGSKG